MKKLISVVLTAMMILSVSAVCFVTGADNTEVKGDWDTYPNANATADTPCLTPGYKYTDEGVKMISPDYTNTVPHATIQTTEKYDIRTGIQMSVRVDEYNWIDGDHWLSFGIGNKQGITPGSKNTPGFFCQLMTESNKTAPTVIYSVKTDAPPQPLEWKLIAIKDNTLNFSVHNDGTGYVIRLNGVDILANEIDDALDEAAPDGKAYINFTMYSAISDNVSCTVTKFGDIDEDDDLNLRPFGTDSKAPEENYYSFAEMSDSATVPANTPAVLFDYRNIIDEEKRSVGVNMKITPTERNSIFCLAQAENVYLNFRPDRNTSFEASDFPVVAVLVKDVEYGKLWFAAGATLTTDMNHSVEANVDFDYTREDGYRLLYVNFAEEAPQKDCEGRLHQMRFDVDNLDPFNEEFNSFYIGFMGAFRSLDEAVEYAKTIPPLGDTVDDTNETETSEIDFSSAESETATAVNNADVTTELSPEHETTDTNGKNKGCGSAITGAAVMLASICLAGVALSKKQ